MRMARAIHFVELEYGIPIFEDYNYIKLLSQLDMLAYKEKQHRIAERKARRK